MDTRTWSDEDRFLLLATLRKFRANYNEKSEDDYSNRDELERKIEQGGELDETDQFVLAQAVANELPDDEQAQRLTALIGWHL